jgi:very-short-patch-repair endonuclease
MVLGLGEWINKMQSNKIITGQQVSPELKARAKELRQEMTPAESKLWQRLRAGRLEGFHFRRQQIIGGYIADFYCHAAGLVVEVDGIIYPTSEVIAINPSRVPRLPGICARPSHSR